MSHDFPAGLPEYYDEYGKPHPFLAALILYELELPEAPEETCICFSAKVKKAEAPFLRELLCYEQFNDEFPVMCCIRQETEKDVLMFEAAGTIGAEDFAEVLPGTQDLPLTWTQFAFGSAMEIGPSPEPWAFYELYIGGFGSGSRRFLCEARQYFGESRRDIETYEKKGSLIGQDNLSIADILEVFGFGKEFDFASFLPSALSCQLFDSLTLESFRLIWEKSRLKSLTLSVEAKQLWKITEQISFIPGFAILIDAPFDSQARLISIRAYGDWQLGTTAYHLYAEPSNGTVTIHLKEGAVLDFSAVTERFLGQTALPDVAVDMLSISLNFLRNEYQFAMRASSVFSFSILGKPFAVTEAGLRLIYRNSRFDVTIMGAFAFLGVDFELICRFCGGDDYNLSAYTSREVGLIAFLGEFLDNETIGNYVPENFLSQSLEKLQISYKHQADDCEFYAMAAVRNVLMISESFRIDDFLIEMKHSKGKCQELNLFARFYVANCGIWLSIKKEPARVRYQGGSESGQSIAIGELLEGFIKTSLGYHVELPKQLFHFVIGHIGFTYSSGEAGDHFSFDCAAGFLDENSQVLSRLFSAGVIIRVSGGKENSVWTHKFGISCEITLNNSQIIAVSYDYDDKKGENANIISLYYRAKNPGDAIAFGDILEMIGFSGISGSSSFLTSIGITEASLSYDFVKQALSAKLVVNSGGFLQVTLICKENFDYDILLTSSLTLGLDKLPVVGGLVGQFAPTPGNFSLSDIRIRALTQLYSAKPVKPGIVLAFKLMGTDKNCQIYTVEPVHGLAGRGVAAKTFWLKLEKKAAIFTLHRVGLSFDQGGLGLLLDASLSVSPLVFDMMGLGLYVNLNDITDIRFSLSGMAVSFSSGTLQMSGAFMKTADPNSAADVYAGSLAITVGQISVFAVGQYSEGSLMAYACVNLPLGGPPAFFVKGLAAGFGYNQALALPDITGVSSYPLILGAKGELDREHLMEKLAPYIAPSRGQNFLAAGVHFTTFEIADSFVLATVGFGKKTEVGILGLSDITMPPNCSKDPIAHAQLALKAAILPDDGLISIEARLTEESFILSKQCRITGGFAFYLWFSGERAGDFVITLGGYHPAYKKPAHYPDVPRLGFIWDVIPEKPNQLVLSGELYFALTPSVMMAGGRLSAVYAAGNLRAWFIARADFLISWKPFYYDIAIGISLGASYKLELWLVHCTFKLELGCDLHIWGPDFAGTAHITWFIISFDIRFGSEDKPDKGPLIWDEFSKSFLPAAAGAMDAAGGRNPLNAAVTGGICGGTKERPYVNAEELELSFTSVFPCAESREVGLYIRPMEAAVVSSEISVELRSDKSAPELEKTVVKRSVPSALWAPKSNRDEMVADMPCGFLCTVKPKLSAFFPKNTYISVELLSERNKIERDDAFRFGPAYPLPQYTAMGTVSIVTETADALGAKGKMFLKELGYTGACDITEFAKDADNLLDEDLFVGEIA